MALLSVNLKKDINNPGKLPKYGS